MNKKSQITIFIIIGIIILLVIFFLSYARNIQKTETETDVNEEVITSILKHKVITEYTETCLEDSLEKSLQIIGQQGGYLYKDQPGNIPEKEYEFITFNNKNFTYLTIPVKDINPPLAPCFQPICYFTLDKIKRENLFKNTDITFPSLSSFYFGEFRLLPFLFKYTRNIKGERIKTPFSIQEQLERFILNQTKECTNITGLQEMPEFTGIQITEGNLSLELKLNEDDVFAILTYPLIIKVDQGKPTTRLLRFTAEADVRFEKIYNAIDGIITKDNQFLDYNITKHTREGTYTSNDYDQTKHLAFREIKSTTEIQKIPLGTTDLFIITDSASKVFGNPYIFQFARKNRYPVLDYINKTIIDEDKTLTFTPKTTDPDEDTITYSYKTEDNWRLSDFSTTTAILTGLVSFTLLHQDIGLHEINITPSDTEYTDYQLFDIRVCGLNNIGSLPDICIEECGASTACNETPIGLLNTCNTSQYLFDKCNLTCQYVESNICGSIGLNCNAPSECDGKIQNYFEYDYGWCYGSEGCENFCTAPEPIIDLSHNWELDNNDTCGCIEDHYHCDIPPYNLNFNGTCLDGVCVGDDLEPEEEPPPQVLYCPNKEPLVDADGNRQYTPGLDICECQFNGQYCDSYPYNLDFLGTCSANQCLGDT